MSKSNIQSINKAIKYAKEEDLSIDIDLKHSIGSIIHANISFFSIKVNLSTSKTNLKTCLTNRIALMRFKFLYFRQIHEFIQGEKLG